jgi:hypothetical protein
MSQDLSRLLAEHRDVSRRYFLGLGAAGAAALSLLPQVGFADEKSPAASPELAEAIAKINYLTPAEEFQTVERGNPFPCTHPPDKLHGSTKWTRLPLSRAFPRKLWEIVIGHSLCVGLGNRNRYGKTRISYLDTNK